MKRGDHGRNAPIRLVLPATSANLGPAFDAAAIALKMFLSTEARAADDFSVVAGGTDAEICGDRREHLILTTYQEVLQAERKPAIPIALQIKNEIPIGKGCGSSAAARLAGIALAVHFGRLSWDDGRIIGEAARREHHADNAAACWLGGLAVARTSDETEVKFASIRPRGRWPLLLAVPTEPLSTEKARALLPGQYARPHAIANVQNSMLLLAALSQGRHDLLAVALDDHFHQPYRAELCPLLPALQKVSGKHGILGVALSGAGPAVLIFLGPNADAARAKRLVARHLQAEGLSAELMATTITQRGARDSHGWANR